MGLDIFIRKISHPRKRREDEKLSEYLCDIRDKQKKEIADEAKKFVDDWLDKHKDLPDNLVKNEISYFYRQLTNKYFDYEYEIKAILEAKSIEEVRKFFEKYDW